MKRYVIAPGTVVPLGRPVTGARRPGAAEPPNGPRGFTRGVSTNLATRPVVGYVADNNVSPGRYESE